MASGGDATGILPELTRDEQAFAGLAHALMISKWWIGPLVIYLIKKESRFVRFHALQALIWQLILTLLYFGGMFTIFAILLTSANFWQPASAANPQFPVSLMIVFSLYWLLSMVAFAISMTLGILFTLKSMRGQWAGYPVIGHWARRLARV